MHILCCESDVPGMSYHLSFTGTHWTLSIFKKKNPLSFIHLRFSSFWLTIAGNELYSAYLKCIIVNGWNKLAFEGWSLRSSVDIVSSSEQIFCTCPSYSRPFQICMENNVIYSWDRVSLCKGLFRHLLIIAVRCVYYSTAHYSSLWQAKHIVTNKSHINGA